MRYFILLPIICLATLHLAAQEPVDPFQPTVSREESGFLSRVLTVAETNTLAAVSLMRQERPEDAESPALDFTLGNLYFQEEQLEQAADAYRVAIEKMPRFRAALMNLGRVLLLQDKPGETIEVYQQLVADGQADADILLLLGHALLLEDAPVGAETAYRQALLLRPRDSEVRMGLAKTLLRQERYREGLALIDEILDRDPLNRELWSLRVNALLSDQKNEEAIRAIEQARRLDRATPEMLATLGDLWINADRPEDALNAYQEAFADESPSLDRMLRALEGFLIVDDLQAAETMADRAVRELERRPDTEARIRLLGLQADLALRRGQSQQAMTLLTRLLNRDPLNGRALLTLSDLQAREDDIETALLTAERAARVEGFEARGLVRQAQLEVGRGHYARAVPLLEAAQAFDPRDSVTRYLEQVRRLAE
jgi:tetratricopeptide (TPR) repeat protein